MTFDIDRRFHEDKKRQEVTNDLRSVRQSRCTIRGGISEINETAKAVAKEVKEGLKEPGSKLDACRALMQLTTFSDALEQKGERMQRSLVTAREEAVRAQKARPKNNK